MKVPADSWSLPAPLGAICAPAPAHIAPKLGPCGCVSVWGDIADLFAGRPDPDWERDRDLIDQSIANPWDRQLAAAVANSGRQPRARVMDLLIAATAYAHTARLYTRNARDLVGIEHLIDIVAL